MLEVSVPPGEEYKASGCWGCGGEEGREGVHPLGKRRRFFITFQQLLFFFLEEGCRKSATIVMMIGVRSCRHGQVVARNGVGGRGRKKQSINSRVGFSRAPRPEMTFVFVAGRKGDGGGRDGAVLLACAYRVFFRDSARAPSSCMCLPFAPKLFIFTCIALERVDASASYSRARALLDG